jgi:hypothetical protein
MNFSQINNTQNKLFRYYYRESTGEFYSRTSDSSMVVKTDPYVLQPGDFDMSLHRVVDGVVVDKS